MRRVLLLLTALELTICVSEGRIQHAYGANGKKEDFTVGASFGGGRELAFKHPASGHEFTIPQNNGDIFAFTSEGKHGTELSPNP